MATFIDYAGQKVRNDNEYSAQLQDGAAAYNKSTGQNLSVADYDKQINPSTYGARQGDAKPLIAGGDTATAASPSSLDPGKIGQWYSNYAAQNPVSSKGYTPDAWKVSDDQTVAGNVKSLIDAGSPLMERQAAAADGQMNARGLVNSTMGVQAAQNAVYDHALQIATPDALTKRTAGQYNVDQSNQAKAFEAGASNNLNLGELQARTQTGTALIGSGTALEQSKIAAQSQANVANISTGSAERIATMNADSQQRIATLDAATRRDLTDWTNKNQTLLNTNTQATTIFNQAVAAISTIQNNPAMDASTKSQAVASVFNMVNSQFTVLSQVSGLKLPELLDFTGGQQQTTEPTPAPTASPQFQPPAQ